MPGMSASDHAKILENSCISDKELISSQDREFLRLTYLGFSEPNRGCSFVEAPPFWNHHTWQREPRVVIAIWSACHLFVV